MTLEEALNTALTYERNVVEVYAEAVGSTADSKGQQVLELLANEERDHVAYLEQVKQTLQATGKLSEVEIQTALPAPEVIQAAVGKLRAEMSDEDRPAAQQAELDLLSRALQVETETSDFYRQVVDQLGDAGKAFFSRFVEIEEGHKTIVQAEIDSVTGTGFWFDFREFDLEAA